MTRLRAAPHDFHERGLFVNHVEAPAVPVAKQRFRISLTADHTRDDIDQLLEGIDGVWATHVLPTGDGHASTLPDWRTRARSRRV
jgi:glycine C-acetyltransferase